MVWKLADAKNKFSEVVNLALHEEPQIISRRGENVIVMSEKSYKKLSSKNQSFLDFLFNAPGLEGVQISRDKSTIRKVEL